MEGSPQQDRHRRRQHPGEERQPVGQVVVIREAEIAEQRSQEGGDDDHRHAHDQDDLLVALVDDGVVRPALLEHAIDVQAGPGVEHQPADESEDGDRDAELGQVLDDEHRDVDHDQRSGASAPIKGIVQRFRNGPTPLRSG